MEDELHFLIICSIYKHLWDKFFLFDAYTTSDPIEAFISRLNENDTANIRHIAAYIEDALAYRNDLHNLQ